MHPFFKHTHNKEQCNRRKFRSQTSDNMDRWKSRGGKSQRREEKKKEDQRRGEKKKEDQRRERVRRKKMQVREKVYPQYSYESSWGWSVAMCPSLEKYLWCSLKCPRWYTRAEEASGLELHKIQLAYPFFWDQSQWPVTCGNCFTDVWLLTQQVAVDRRQKLRDASIHARKARQR